MIANNKWLIIIAILGCLCLHAAAESKQKPSYLKQIYSKSLKPESQIGILNDEMVILQKSKRTHFWSVDLIGSDGKLLKKESFKTNSTFHPTSIFQANKNKVYILTYNPDRSNHGIIYSYQLGHSLHLIHHFSGKDGTEPTSLVVTKTGEIVGITLFGGLNNKGVVFSITNGKYNVIHSFGGNDGALPSDLIQNVNGTLYGCTYRGGKYNDGVIFTITLNGTYHILHDFDGIHGALPLSLVAGLHDHLYGTTTGIYGFNMDKKNKPILKYPMPNFGNVVFSISDNGSYHIIHKFNGTDGLIPTGIVIGENKILYGSTTYGGRANFGNIYRITPNGKYSVMHSFKTFNAHQLLSIHQNNYLIEFKVLNGIGKSVLKEYQI